MTMIKKIISVIMAIAMALSIGYFPSQSSAEEITGYETANDFSTSGTCSFGAMFANEISKARQAQTESNGYIIYSIEILDNTAIVEYQAQETCTLVVGIYDETGDTLLGIGRALVTADISQTYVDIEVDSMPQSFYLRGFLTDGETLRPNSMVYESPMYTREMQEFLSKTTDDFDSDRVLNLDDSKENNFAVYSNEVKIISVDNGVNVITEIDRDNNTYTFENADTDILQLDTGDIFSCLYGDEVLIVKTASVNVEGTAVTVVGVETKLEDVFDYLKIEETPDTEAFDVSDISEGIVYTGVVKETEKLVNGQSGAENTPYSSRISIETGLNKKHSFELDGAKLGQVEITGSVTFGISGVLKAYISRSESYIELRIDYSITPDVHISGKADGKLKICSFGFSPFLGVYIDFTPSIIVKVNAIIEAKASIDGTIGVKMGTNGFENLTGNPTIRTDFDFQGSVYIGISFEPKVKIISDDIAYIKLTAEVGGTLKGKMDVSPVKENGKAWHTCQRCIDGDIIGSAKISMVGSIWNDKDLTFTVTLININEKLCDFYYSLDHKTGGFTECPYWKTRVTVRVTDDQGNPLNGAKVRYGGADRSKLNLALIMNMKNFAELYETAFEPKGADTANADGIFSVMVDNNDFLGEVIIVEASNNGYTTQKVAVVLSHKESSITVKLTPDGTSKSSLSFVDANNNASKRKNIAAEKVIAGQSSTAVITTDGTLYTSGTCTYHIVYGKYSTQYANTSTVPFKITENAIDVLDVEHGMGVVTSDNVLHAWGTTGKFGPTLDSYFDYEFASSSPGSEPAWVAKAPLSNIKSIAGGGVDLNSSWRRNLIAVITTSDELYLCGSIGGFGYGYDPNDNYGYSRIYGKFFEKVMDNVSSVSIGGYDIAVITKDGSLYIWGDDVTQEDKTSPVKIMDNVASVSCGNNYGAAVTTTGELYMWGGWPTYSTTPVKVMNDVASVSVGDFCNAVVTKDGSLYTCSANSYWGNDAMGRSETPKKIMDDVVSVDVGASHCTALKKDGSVWVWGHNSAGQFGNGTTVDSLDPIKFVIPQETEITGLVFSVPAGYTYDGNSKYILYDSGNTISVSEQRLAGAVQHADFTDLIPNSVYNFYALRSDTAEDLLSEDNVLYISQAVSDSNGELTVDYYSDVSASDSVMFVKGMERIDLSKAQIYTFPQYTDGEEVFAKPIVYYNDERLTAGRDYTLDGSISSETPGIYTITLNGKGDFCGSQSTEWEVLSLNDNPFEKEKPSVEIMIPLPTEEPPDTSFRYIAAYQSGSLIKTMLIAEDGSYDPSVVTDGRYTFTVCADNCAPKSFAVTVSSGEVIGLDKNIELHLLGDIDGNGKVNTLDVAKANAHAKNKILLSGYDLAVGDIDGNGKVNTLDVAKINAHAKNKIKIW